MEASPVQLESSGAAFTGVVAAAVFVYCVVSVVILWAYARTRLYPLYVLKVSWIGFTILCFLWIFAMSCSDPGPKHGGVAPEFLRNPAGPFSALGDYADVFTRLYATTPWWAFLVFPLLLLWRALSGHRRAGEDDEAQRRLRKCFLAVTASAMGLLLLFLDFRYARDASGMSYLRYTGVSVFAVLSVTWVFLPLRWRRKGGGYALLVLALLAAVPLLVAFSRLDWSRYGYMAYNYAFAWRTARMGDYALNSFLVSVVAVGVTMLLGSMAAYALTRLEFAGRNVILLGFIGAMVIPAQLYIVPLFLMLQGWQFTMGEIHFSFMDSRLGLGLIYAAGGLPFAVFLLTGFYRTLPTTLGESASIDGCGEWRMFTDIYFPLATPGLATAAIFQFLSVWNEYRFALVFLTNEKLKTLPVGLYNLSVSQQYAANWPALFAGVMILCVPTFLIFIVLQERIVAGLTVGAIKA